jgi:hypothetical protein
VSDASILPMGFSAVSFVIKEGASVLIPGVIYSISLKCTTLGSSATARLDLEVNSPPQGGTCQSCLTAEGNGCSKTGSALIDTFVISCSRFADADAPLRYEFGYKVRDGPEIWFLKTSWPSQELRLPSGTIQTLARVVDSAGAATAVWTDTLSVGTSRRRLFADIDFNAAVDLVTAKMQTQDAEALASTCRGSTSSKWLCYGDRRRGHSASCCLSEHKRLRAGNGADTHRGVTSFGLHAIQSRHDEAASAECGVRHCSHPPC